MNVQWYPGHMTKAKRMMQEDIKLVDLVVELVDARVPLSSRNPDINALASGKSRMIILNKADLADPSVTKQWKQYFESQGYHVTMMDARKRNGMNEVTAGVFKVCEAKFERDRRRGIKNRPARAMIVGIPNVGKSTFINSYAKKACAKTGNKPGVTKGKQWIKLNKDVELLDTPGILWPKFEDQSVGLRLAMIGSIKDDILNLEELAMRLVYFLLREYRGLLAERYGIVEEDYQQCLTQTDDRVVLPLCHQVLESIAQNRNFLVRGGESDVSKAAQVILDEFRSGVLGRISLEKVPAEEEGGLDGIDTGD